MGAAKDESSSVNIHNHGLIPLQTSSVHVQVQTVLLAQQFTRVKVRVLGTTGGKVGRVFYPVPSLGRHRSLEPVKYKAHNFMINNIILRGEKGVWKHEKMIERNLLSNELILLFVILAHKYKYLYFRFIHRIQ